MKKFFLMAVAAVALVSCSAIKSPVGGSLYLDVKDGMSVTANAGSSKVGTGTIKGYLSLIATGDASIQSAAKKAGITKIHHVDYQSKSILGIINDYTIFVYGN